MTICYNFNLKRPLQVNDIEIIYCSKCGEGYLTRTEHERCYTLKKIPCKKCGIECERKEYKPRNTVCYACKKKRVNALWKRKKNPMSTILNAPLFPREVCDCGKPTNRIKKYCSIVCQRAMSQMTFRPK